MGRQKPTEELRRLTEALAEEVLHAADEEVLLELVEEGTVEKVEAAAQGDLAAVKAKIGRRRLAAAKQAVAAGRRPSRPQHRFDIREARQRLSAAVMRSASYAQPLTLAARAGKKVPDEDLEGLIQDAEELGIDLSEDMESET